MRGRRPFRLLSAALGTGLLGSSFPAPSPLPAQTLSGRVTTSLYTFERADAENEASTVARGYQTLQLSLAHGRASLHTYGQADHDFGSRVAGDPKLRLYGLYLEWKGVARRATVRLGRQPVFASAATGNIDGARVRVDVMPWLQVQAFGGALPPPDQKPKLTGDVDRNYLFGGRLLASPLPEARVGLSYAIRRRLRDGFRAVRTDSLGNLFERFVEPSDRDLELASVDAAWTPSSAIALRGRGDVDLERDRITRAGLTLRSEVSPGIAARGGYTYRFPRLPASSIFAVFDAREHHEIEGGVSFAIERSLRLRLEGAGILHDGDESYRASIGLETGRGDVSYRRRGGFAGSLDGVSAAFHHAFRDGRLTPRAQVSWASYRAESGRGDRESLLATAAGAAVRLGRSFSLDAEVQLLHNRHYSRDVRFFVRLRHRFFARLGGDDDG